MADKRPRGSADRPRSVRITLPLPPIGCSPNWQPYNVRARSKARAAFRRDVGFAAMSARNREGVSSPFGVAVIDAAFFTGGSTSADARYRPKDRDNAIASLKGAVDALKDARLISGDSAARLRWGDVTIIGTKKEHGGSAELVVTVREVSA